MGTESNGDGVDELPADTNWSEEGAWANREVRECLAIRDVYISDTKPIEEGTDSFCRVERSGSSECVSGCYAYPDGRVGTKKGPNTGRGNGTSMWAGKGGKRAGEC